MSAYLEWVPVLPNHTRGNQVSQLKSFRCFDRFRFFLGVFVLLLASVPAHSQKTLMFMVDFWGQRDQTDTIINLRVFQPTSEISYLPGGGIPPFQLANVYETERFGWWYALPNFRADDYGQGRIRINTLYQRGWYQMDSTYRVLRDTILVLSDTATSFTYRDPTTQMDVKVTLPLTGPKTVSLPTGATYRGPKLYTSAGNSETSLLNMRNTTLAGMQPGNIDRCVDTIPADTVWIRFGAINSLPGQSPATSSMRCTSYNPYSTRAALVYLRNPWPGADQPVVEFNGQNVPLYPGSNPDWLVADLRYLAPLGVPSGKIRFKKSASSGIYFDSAGVEQGIVAPFTLPSLTGGTFYYVPPEAGAPMVSGTGNPPAPKYFLYVQNPWKPGSPRLLWESDKGYHVMRPTQSCGWFRYPLYAAPTRVLIGHSFEDSTYGSTGVQFRARENWIDIPASAIVGGAVYIKTMQGTTRLPAAVTTTPDLKDCSSDTLKLVMEAFDFLGRGKTGGNPAFQVGGDADNLGTASSGLVKRMVQSNLTTATGLPVYTGRDSGYQVGGINGIGKGIAGGPYGKSTPSNWFDTTALKAAVPGIQIGHGCVELPLTKGPADSGYYKYNNQNFFPLDTITDKRGYSPLLAADKELHNFLFCMHGHAAFEYTPGLKFEFRGDDDVWVFINNKLAVDLGGTHGPESASIDLNRLKLREGSVYPFDIFYCERQTNGSSILIRTTMDLQPSWKYRATPTAVGGALKVVIEGQKTSNYTPSCADLTSGQVLPWVQTEGRMVVVGPDGSDLNEVYMSDVSLYGGNLSYSAGAIQLDTNKLKQQPELRWPGKYTIRIESRLGDSLYSIAFNKLYGAVVVNGLVFDANGDGVADSIRLTAPMGIFRDDPAYHLTWFKASGAKDSVKPAATSVRRISDSIVVAPLAGVNWGRRTEIPAGVRIDSVGAILSHPGGIATNVVNPIRVFDGIAPVADSARLSFATAGASDTLRVWVNENAVRNMGATAADVWVKVGRSSLPRDAVVLDGGVSGREILLVLAAGHGILPSDSVRIAGLVADAAQNGAANSSVWVPIRSNAQGSAALSDVDGDGRADHLSVQLKGNLAGVANVQIDWKDAAGLPVSRTWPVSGTVNGSFTVDAGALTFPKGATSCLGGGCSVSFLDAVGKTIQNWSLIDSVAPMAVRGHYSFGSLTDTLWVKFSEPLASVSDLPAWLEWGSAGAPLGLVGHSTVALLGNKDSAYFVLESSKGIPATCDSIRMAVGLQAGRVVDLGGIKPGTQSPWAPLDFGIPPMLAVLRDPSGAGMATTLDVLPVRPVPAGALASIASLRITWNTAQGAPDFRDIAFSSLVATTTGWTTTLAVPFEFAATACLSGGCGVLATSAVGSKAWDLLDGVPPTLVRARYRFSGTGANADTMILRSSEPWIGAATTTLVPFAMTGKAAPKNLPMISWTVSVDGFEAQAILDSVGAILVQLDDSARYVGGALAQIVDAFGNRPGEISPWRPIEFGMRPPTLLLAPYPPGGVLKNGGGVSGAWEAPVATIPSTELLVFDAPGGTLSPNPDLSLLKTPDGLAPKNDLTKVLAVRVLLNRPLEGQLIIYDNLGTHVSVVDLTPMNKAWLADSTRLDQMREVWMVWNGTDGKGKFAASGVYLFRAIVKVDNGDRTHTFRNLVWKLGWHRDTKK